jgi:hypothetical protein
MGQWATGKVAHFPQKFSGDSLADGVPVAGNRPRLYEVTICDLNTHTLYYKAQPAFNEILRRLKEARKQLYFRLVTDINERWSHLRQSIYCILTKCHLVCDNDVS